MSDPAQPAVRPGAPSITTFLMFSGSQYGKAEEAIRFYVSIFPNSRLESIARHGPGEGAPAGELRRAAFILAGQRFLATEGATDPPAGFTPAISLYVECASSEEVRALFGRLSEGGRVLMEPASHRSSHLFALLDDKFGVSWQLEFPKKAPASSGGPGPS